jgi:hypothetical protein
MDYSIGFQRSLAKNTGPYRDRGASVALQGVLGSIVTVLIRRAYSPETFNRVFHRKPRKGRKPSKSGSALTCI